MSGAAMSGAAMAGTTSDDTHVCEWRLPLLNEPEVRKLAEDLRVSPLLAQLLINRGISSADVAYQFLKGGLSELPSPTLLLDMDLAVARVMRALEHQELICIYGDYDLDGICASTILYSFLSHYHSRLELFIPHRERDGYGLQQAPLEKLIAQGVTLVITCDNGTSALDEIAWARTQGVDVIVTDHHTLPLTLPVAAAVLNPMRPETPEAFRVLSGTGVAFMLALALRKTLRDTHPSVTPPNLKRMLDLVTLGTIADVVPLTGVNRLLVRAGLEELSARRRPGLLALLEVSGVAADEAVSNMTVGFRLAPRLNAAGRLEDASLAVHLLLSSDLHESRRLAAQLEKLNRRRQALEEEILKDIQQELARLPDVGHRLTYVFGSQRWHPGVVGVVAARLVEMTHRPGIVLAFSAQEGRGSGRSIPGFDLVRALESCHDLLGRYGGHRMAAGMSLQYSQLGAFADRFEAAAAEQVAGLSLNRVLNIDAELPLQDVTEQLLDELEQLKPFGPGNVEPIFCSSGLQILDHRTVGRGHLRMRLSQRGRVMAGIGFRLADRATAALVKGPVSLAYFPELNRWKGSRTIQLRVCDLRAEDTQTLVRSRASVALEKN